MWILGEHFQFCEFKYPPSQQNHTKIKKSLKVSGGAASMDREKTRIKLGVSLFVLLLIEAVIAGSFVLAKPVGRFMGADPLFDSPSIYEQNSSVSKAIAEGDYSAYMAALESEWLKFKAGMTEDRFKEMVTMMNQSKRPGPKEFNKFQNGNFTNIPQNQESFDSSSHPTQFPGIEMPNSGRFNNSSIKPFYVKRGRFN
jgi:hypothetical protein